MGGGGDDGDDGDGGDDGDDDNGLSARKGCSGLVLGLVFLLLPRLPILLPPLRPIPTSASRRRERYDVSGILSPETDPTGCVTSTGPGIRSNADGGREGGWRPATRGFVTSRLRISSRSDDVSALAAYAKGSTAESYRAVG